MAKFQIRKQANNHYRFIVKAGNGLTVLTSESYKSMDNCLGGIESLKESVMDNNRYELRKSLNMKHYFIVMDAEGVMIGSSEMYESSSGRDIGIGLLKMNVPLADIEDLTGPRSE
jgi:uncharacterized protein YegP (UPF0339 family)